MIRLENFKDEIKNEAKLSKNIVDLTNKIREKHKIGSYKSIRLFLIREKINISHFESHSQIMNRSGCIKKGRQLDELMSSGFIQGSLVSRCVIKSNIIKYNLIPYSCSECKCNNKWRNKIMPLILDHINGINNDHRLENLRFLCPNCNSIQDTFCGKNKNRKNQPKLVSALS